MAPRLSQILTQSCGRHANSRSRPVRARGLAVAVLATTAGLLTFSAAAPAGTAIVQAVNR